MSRLSRMLVIVLLSYTICGLTSQTGAAPQPVPPTQPTAAKTVDDIQATVLPAIDMQSVPLSDFLDFVVQLVPGFQFVIVRDPGVPSEYPTLPTMKLKKVTFGQVLSVIQEAMPGIDMHPIESEKGALIYMFKIQGSAAGFGQAPETALKIYRLADAIDLVLARNSPAAAKPPQVFTGSRSPVADDAKKPDAGYDVAIKAARKSALDSVLSLVKAALAQSGDTSVPPLVQVHEETETLIVRGTANQIGAVESALEALTPRAVLAPLKEKFAQSESRLQSELARTTDETARRTAELQAARNEIDSLHQDMAKLEMAQERFKAQLELAKKKTGGKE